MKPLSPLAHRDWLIWPPFLTSDVTQPPEDGLAEAKEGGPGNKPQDAHQVPQKHLQSRPRVLAVERHRGWAQQCSHLLGWILPAITQVSVTTPHR